LIRILQSLDSRQDTPQFQSAIAALSLGTPTGADFVLENSMVSMKSELLIAGMKKVPLPILDSASLGDIMSVSGLKNAGGSLALVRRTLLFLTADSLDDFQKTAGNTIK